MPVRVYAEQVYELTNDRREALRRQIEVQRDKALSLSRLGPSCLYCVHGPAKSAKGICQHPVFWRMEANPVIDADPLPSVTSTMRARSSDGLCGPEAQLFEARFVLSRLWRAATRSKG